LRLQVSMFCIWRKQCQNWRRKVGVVKMYDEEIFIDISSGMGIERVLKKIEPLINKWAADIRFGDMPFEDRKQEIYIIALQGIEKYDDSKGTKLSSFLHTHIKNKILSKIRSVNKKSNNANVYLTADSGYLREIPESQIVVSDSKESSKDINLFDVYYDQSSEIGDDSEIVMQELRESLTEREFSIVSMLDIGMSIREISDELEENYWTVSKAVNKIRNSKVLQPYKN